MRCSRADRTNPCKSTRARFWNKALRLRTTKVVRDHFRVTANHLLENRLVESISSIHAGSREGNGAGRLFDEDLILQKRTVRDTRLECPGHLPRNPETGEPAGGGRCRPPPEELHHPTRIERRRPGIPL